MQASSLLADLCQSGRTQIAIAADLGISQGHLNDLMSGRIKEPRFSLMVRLIELHKKHSRAKQRAERRSKA